MMTWEEFQSFVKGKLFLVGLCFYDSDNKLLEQYQTSGTLVELTDTGLLMLQRTDNSLFALPYDNETISKAEPGEYTEHSTGITIKNPDFIVSGHVEVKDPENIDSIKKNGFYPV